MKVTVARIRLYLKEGKTLSDGSNPIMVMVSFNGRKEKASGFSCVPKYWDKKSQCVKKGFPNYAAINSSLAKIKNELIERRNEFERLGIRYTPKMIIEGCREELSSKNGEVMELIDAYAAYKGLRESTIFNWHYLGHLLREYGIDDICELSRDMALRFPQWLSVEKKIKDGVVRMLIGKVKALCSYSLEQGVISINPMEGFKYLQKFGQSSKLLYIHHSSIEVIKEYLENLMINVDGKMWSYKDGVLEELGDKNSSLFAIYFFMLDYLWQGLSPIDIALIKVEDIDVKRVGDDDFYAWDGKRMKTSVGVKVRIPRHTRYVEMMMFPLMSRVGYILPFFDKNPNCSVDKKKRMLGTTFTSLRPRLKEHFRKVNDIIVAKNMSDGTTIPLIDMDCNLYAARHSFAMNFMLKGGTPMALATLLGRSPNTLAQYLGQLEEETDLARYVSVL